jgi:multicomponent Na+:H+ antiporter subunit D
MPHLQMQILRLIATGKYAMPITLIAGLLFVGIAIKSALFPFGTWLPMAHGGATTTSSAILSGLVLKGYIMLLVKIFYRIFTIDLIRSLHVTDVMYVCGLIGMIYGSIEAYREEHIKRMLAHSSMAQIGYIFMGLGLDVNLGIAAAFLQIVVHAFVKPLLFLSAGRLSEIYNHEKSSYRLRGSAHKDWVAGIGFTLGSLSMVGIPLLGGFLAKYYLIEAAMQNPYKLWPALFTLMISAVMNALYYIPGVIAIWTRSELSTANPVEHNIGFTWIAAPVLSIAVVFLGVNGTYVMEIIQRGLALL